MDSGHYFPFPLPSPDCAPRFPPRRKRDGGNSSVPMTPERSSGCRSDEALEPRHNLTVYVVQKPPERQNDGVAPGVRLVF